MIHQVFIARLCLPFKNLWCPSNGDEDNRDRDNNTAGYSKSNLKMKGKNKGCQLWVDNIFILCFENDDFPKDEYTLCKKQISIS